MSKKRTLDAFFSPTVKKPKTELGAITPSDHDSEEVRNLILVMISYVKISLSLHIQNTSSTLILSRTYQSPSARSWPLYQINLAEKSMTSLTWISCTLNPS